MKKQVAQDSIEWTLDLGVLGELDVELFFDYERGQKEQGPTYSSGGEPAIPSQATITEIRFNGMDVTWFLNEMDPDYIEEMSDACCQYMDEGGDEDVE